MLAANVNLKGYIYTPKKILFLAVIELKVEILCLKDAFML